MNWLIELRIGDSEADVDGVYTQIENLLFNMGEIGTLSIREDTDAEQEAR
jgi:hypothetical protein